MDQDNRQHQRVRAGFTVRAEAISRDPWPGVDLSRGGLFVSTDRYLPINAVLRLTIVLEGSSEEIPVTCRVAYVRDRAQANATGKPVGMGLELLDISKAHRQVLDELLASKSVPRPPVRREPLGGRLNVVVADDDEHYRQFAAEPFRKRGDRVRTTSDGLEALAMCLKEAPDLILSDVTMPRMDGWQLLRLVRARPSLAAVPVIFLTVLSGDAERLLGYQLGVDGYIPKPYSPDELLLRAHQIVRRARNARSQPSMRTTLRGELHYVAPGSLLSFLELERKTGVLLIIGSAIARAFFREGQLHRVEIEGTALDSRKAAEEMLNWTSGQFEFAPQDVACRDELGQSVSALLLEHAQRSDEGRL